jgi:HlyD family secretion protein
VLLLSACGVGAAGGQASGGAAAKPGAGGPPPAPVGTAKATQGPIVAGLTFSGDVTASQQVNLLPKTAGIVVKLMADVGNTVKTGQVVAQLDHATQDAAVAQAQAQLEVAQNTLAKDQAQGRPEDVAKAQAALTQQQAKLTQMQAQGRPESVAQAQANLDSANAKLSALQNGADQQTIAADKAAEGTAQAKLNLLQSPAQLDAYKQAQAVAQNKLTSDQITRDAACRNKGASCDAANATVNADISALNAANDTLALNTDPQTLQQAQNALAQAQAQLAKDETNAPSNLAQAQAAVAAAQQALALAKTPNQAGDIAQQQALVSSASASLSEAKTPFLPGDIQTAQAQVDAAQANLQAAQVNQSLTQVTAPFDGIISARLLTEGALASTTTPIFTEVSNAVEVDLPVGQESRSQINDGQPAQLASPALGTKTVDGKISSISPAADPKSRTFLVRVVPAVQDGTLKPGMSASVNIATQEKPNALLIPKDAVTTDPNTGSTGVYVVTEGQNGAVAQFKTPTLGVSDDRNIEVLSGLNPGDEVVVNGQGTLTNNQRVRAVGPAASGAGQGAPNASGRPQASGSFAGRPQPGASFSGRPQGSGQAAARPGASASAAGSQ